MDKFRQGHYSNTVGGNIIHLPKLFKKNNSIFLILLLFIIISISIFNSGNNYSLSHLGTSSGSSNHVITENSIKNDLTLAKDDDSSKPRGGDIKDTDFVQDIPFMPKMANETLKQELGNAAWKLLHTVLSRYPEEPTTLQKNYLTQFISSFAQVYPCGDCARHFRKLLNKYPPQLSSRITAAVWGCHIHNQVNERLHKEIYDCSHILEDYDCGCGTDELESDFTLGGASLKGSKESEGNEFVKKENQVDDKELSNSKISDSDEVSEHLKSIKIESSENKVGG